MCGERKEKQYQQSDNSKGIDSWARILKSVNYSRKKKKTPPTPLSLPHPLSFFFFTSFYVRVEICQKDNTYHDDETDMLLGNKQHLLVLASLYYINKDLFHIKMKEDIDECGWTLILLREAEHRQSSIYRRDGGTVCISRA